MARAGSSSSGGGCGGLIAILIVIGAIVGAAISLAAIVDPFGWMPPLDVLWADKILCTKDALTKLEETLGR